MPAHKEMPSTVRRSSKRAPDTWAMAHDSAVESYGEGERAHRTAYAALKHSFEKVGDHWDAKGDPGPSDAQAARSHRDRPARTAGGVDANATKEHLLQVARRLDVPGRSKLDKQQLIRAIERANARRSGQARER
jgi:hypothetical protein